MKHLFIKVKNYFRSLMESPNQDPVLRKMDRAIDLFVIVIVIVIVFLITCTSCGSSRQVTQLVEHVQKDTIYLSNIQYDSIYIYQEVDKDFRRGIPHPSSLNPHPSPDTLYIKDVSIEYRYKLLRDTVRVAQRDSIPYEVTITEVKEIKRPLTWFDHLSRICFGICLSGLLILLYKFLKYFRSGGILNH